MNTIENSNDDLITGKDEIVNEFNEYFSSIGIEYAERIEEVEDFIDDDKYVNETVYFLPKTPAEIISTINEH